MTLCEVLDTGYAILAESAESLDKLDEELGITTPDTASTHELIMGMGGEVG